MVHFPANVFQEVTQITDALKRNALDQNEQIILGASLISYLTGDQKQQRFLCLTLRMRSVQDLLKKSKCSIIFLSEKQGKLK